MNQLETDIFKFELRLIELVRREYLLPGEARLCLSMGYVPDLIKQIMKVRMDLDALADVPGIKRIDNDEVAVREYFRIKLLINPVICN